MVGAKDRLALLIRHLAQIAEGTGDETAALYRQITELPHGCPDLLTLRLGEMLHRFVPLKDATPLLVGHTVELGQAIQHALLGLLRKLPEARFALECGVLLR
ncbi:hypothetical protein BH10ACI4_BH10ACI4_02240 [soil metagenome]